MSKGNTYRGNNLSSYAFYKFGYYKSPMASSSLQEEGTPGGSHGQRNAASESSVANATDGRDVDDDRIGTRSLVRWMRSPTQISNSCFQQVPTAASTQICIEAIQIRSLLHETMTLSHPLTPATLPSTHPSTKRSAWRFQWTDLVAGHPHMHESGEVSVSLIRELRKVGD
jgi:hypothetical protein